ncbi:hypothetical protein GC089_17970 [Cellulomonas sp. JZ18]|uniref:DUF732 domain-containing protein n=1 Tax=Cellulomonas sp. JZ18 TaxID=2654191 RepID=UPI0012D4161E|nr:DUF732 domain-containing protein [Cellulomonas sp. JZ18]QGQ20730.1 hypothetical protein GC089_17970 [Cellulomonas sp. JZ18]
MRRTAPLIVAACTLAGLLAGCSGQDEPDEATPTTDPREAAYTEAMAQVAGVAREDWSDEHVLDVGRAICARLEAGEVTASDVLPWVMGEYGAEDSAAVAAATQAPRHLCPQG